MRLALTQVGRVSDGVAIVSLSFVGGRATGDAITVQILDIDIEI